MDEYKPKINVPRTACLIVVTIVLMAVAGWLISRENFYRMFQAITSANPLLIASAIAVYFVSMAIWAGRWRTTLSFIDCKIGFATRYLILCATVFLNNVTPAVRAGGDPFGRIYMVHKLENISYSQGMASLVGELALTPLVVVSFLMAGLLLEFGRDSLQLNLVLTAVWALAAFALVFFPRLFFKKRIAAKGISSIINRVLGWFGRRKNVPELMAGIEAFYSNTYTIMDKWQKVLLVGSWTLLIGAFDILRLCVIFLALGYHPKLSTLLVASSLPIIVGLIPLLPGGLVLVEGSLISIFVLFGVPPDVAMAATLIERGIVFVLSTIVGAVIFSYLGVRMAPRPQVRNE
ncbi:MAG: flippase-like domain-containing protein [Dehalococcoidia bacterium]